MVIVDDDRHKILWFGMYDGIEWECSPDSITIEFTPAAKPGQTPKKMGSTMITPQARLVDSLASRAIYMIERRAKKKNNPMAAVAAPISSNNARRPSIGGGAVSPTDSNAPLVDKRQSKSSTNNNEADYLNAINAIRRQQ
jgi:hypothetical protein